jgi:hypothetical protein
VTEPIQEPKTVTRLSDRPAHRREAHSHIRHGNGIGSKLTRSTFEHFLCCPHDSPIGAPRERAADTHPSDTQAGAYLFGRIEAWSVKNVSAGIL